MARGAHVEVRNVTFRYEQGHASVPVLDRLSFEVRAGEFAAVVGRSGCGKTTLLNLLAGFLPCTEGAVFADGVRIEEPSPERAVILQENNLLPWLTVAGNVMLPLLARRMPHRNARARVWELLELVGMEGYSGYYPSRLSGGMKQRVAFVRALAAEPKVILMDEPFTSLDWVSRQELQQELLAVLERGPRTVILVTHDLDEALFLADRVLVMSGRPASLASAFTVDVPRPRDRTPERALLLLALKERLLAGLSPGTAPHASGGTRPPPVERVEQPERGWR